MTAAATFAPSPKPAGNCRFNPLAALAVVIGIAAATPCSAAPAQVDRFALLRGQDLRVASVAYKLAVTNKRLCRAKLSAQPGFILHSIQQYQSSDRADAARSFGLGAHVGVMAVVAGSPAAAAGLAANDQLLSVNGRSLSVRSIASDGSASRVLVDHAQQILAEEMGRGAVTLRVARGSTSVDLELSAELGCPSNVELALGDEVNAWADGERVVVSAGILGRCASDDDLALVIGHELAHNYLHHRGERAGAAMREGEEDADRLAVSMVIAAAYDVSKADSFLEGLLDTSGATAATHPAPARRLKLLRAAISKATAPVILS